MLESAIGGIRRPKALVAFAIGIITVAVYVIAVTAQGNNSATQTAFWAATMVLPSALALIAWRTEQARTARRLLISAAIVFALLGLLGALSIGVGFLLAGLAAFFGANDLADSEKGRLP